MKTIIGFIVVIIVVPIFMLGWCHYMEHPETYFASYDEAEKSGIMGAGWLPAYIPKSSFCIRAAHNRDTNRVEMSFRYKPGDSSEVNDNCLSSKVIEGGTEYQCEYFGNKVTIILYTDGTAELHSYGS